MTHRLPFLFLLATAAAPAWAEEAEKEDLDGDRAVDVGALPAPIVATIQERWPGAQLVSAEAEKKLFEVEIATVRGERFEVLLNARGKVKHVEAAEEDESREGEEGEEEE